ncbi:MAG: GxxExxY protein [Candidatus Zambryskibacteria bacterium]|nr:GxxExxY protein [Candidatus Zambryskibacteria bacterium]
MKLDSPLTAEFRLQEVQKKALKKMRLETVENLLYYFPVRYGDTSEIKNIEDLYPGETATLFGKISGLKMSKAFVKKIPMGEATLQDDTGKIKIVWFHQPYIAKMVHEGQMVRVEGKVSERRGELYISNPKIETISTLPNFSTSDVEKSLFGNNVNNTHESHGVYVLYPVYPESRGVTSNWIYHAIQKLMSRGVLDIMVDPIPEEILKKYNLPNIRTAFIWIHAPKKESDALSARKRFAFQEIFFIQLQKQQERKLWNKKSAFKIETNQKDIAEFIKRFPFNATDSQKKAIKVISEDFKRGYPMSRLLEGDVGSGKTAVAATAIYVATKAPFTGKDYGNLQTAYMAPTEILAKQHYENFIEFFEHLPLKIGLITGSGCQIFPSKSNPLKPTHISRSQLLKWVAEGVVPILIGTHTLIQKSVVWKHLAFVVIDEQHRFGVNQRTSLVRRQEIRQDADKTRTEDSNPEIIYKDLTYCIREAIFTVRKTLGLGHKELIYQRALAEEFTKRGIIFSREKQIPIYYNKKEVGIYQPDFVIDEKIIVELKAIPFIGTSEKKQIWTYLKGSNYHLALLVNFSNIKCTIDRIIYQTARLSASGPQLSALCPHLLSMTATPIPRTLALTIYGDLDLTLLSEMPHGRKPIISTIVLPTERSKAYDEIRERLRSGRQLYVICPRINEPDPEKELAIIAKSVTAEEERLKKEIFPKFSIDILHSKMTPAQKEKVMADFASGKIRILVATSVVEVGVNVENATMIIIEGAERFGLSQLHQLRGRVIRSNHQAYCYVFTESKSLKTKERLKALTTAKNGFELAEFDLAQRGAGELYGRKQWGLSDLAMEAVKNIKMVEAARSEAIRIVEEDFDFKKYPEIKKYLEEQKEKIHFE